VAAVLNWREGELERARGNGGDREILTQMYCVSRVLPAYSRKG
jgi:hypothetical protein